MINLDSAHVSILLESLGQLGDKCSDPAYLASKYFEEPVAISGYCVSFALCKRTKGAAVRLAEAREFARFVDECYVDFCTFDDGFVEFMLRHVRDSSVALPDQIRDLHDRKLSHDYANAIRS